MLQAEINRMARGTRHPEMLREIFAGLDDDPQLIAEALARPVLVERLIRNFYANDRRLQAGSSRPTFEEWWQGVKGDFSARPAAVKDAYQLPAVEAAADAGAPDTWRPMSALPAATGTAVWTGTEMIVWGGLAKTGVAQRDVYTGARYDAAGDTWTPTAILRAPSARSAHVALWTGSGMIVWGGDASNYTGTATHGAIYTPGSTTPKPTPTPTPTPTGTPLTNFALSANGGVASASSTTTQAELPGLNFSPSGVIDGDRKGLNWEHGGGWRDATNGAFPDWVQIDFSGAVKKVDEVSVFSLQDNYTGPAEPTEGMAFTKYGVTAFEVQYWDGSQWVTVPGGAITNNNLVRRKVTFPVVTTSKVRVVVHNALGGRSRIVEVEAVGPAS